MDFARLVIADFLALFLSPINIAQRRGKALERKIKDKEREREKETNYL